MVPDTTPFSGVMVCQHHLLHPRFCMGTLELPTNNSICTSTSAYKFSLFIVYLPSYSNHRLLLCTYLYHSNVILHILWEIHFHFFIKIEVHVYVISRPWSCKLESLLSMFFWEFCLRISPCHVQLRIICS